jgi:hypothetical protein
MFRYAAHLFAVPVSNAFRPHGQLSELKTDNKIIAGLPPKRGRAFRHDSSLFFTISGRILITTSVRYNCENVNWNELGQDGI